MPKRVFEPNFSHKSIQTWSQMKLEIFMQLEKLLATFYELYFLCKVAPKLVFGLSIFEKLKPLHLFEYTHRYQMKAKIILNSYLSSKSTIGYENFLKKDEFQNFLLPFSKKKNFECKFFNISFSIPPKFYFGMIFNTKKEIYMKD